MTKKLFGFLFACIMMFSGASFAQQSPADAGAYDTLDLVFSVIPDFTTNQLKFRTDLYVFNDANTYTAATAGFSWDNPNLQMDSAKASPLTQSGFDGGVFFYENASIAQTNANRRFLFGAFKLTGTGVTPNPTRRLWASYYFTLTSWNANDSICLDSLAFNVGSIYAFADAGGNEIAPYFTGKQCAFDSTYTPPSAIVLTPDSLHFSGIAGGVNPPGQSFQVTSDNADFPFTLTETSSWIVATPVLGTTPKTINVSANITALPAGNYKDSILVSAPIATNTPQYAVITLELVPPAPIIFASPSSFIFNGIANGSNPASKILTIKNTGGSVLNWTVSSTQSWLDLSPPNGTDSAAVTVAVDITGLPAGTYYDTIVISDPSATNNPVKRPVTLNLGSDLPSIVAPDTVYIVIPNDSTSIAPRTFTITNGGIGSLSFSVSETSPRILSLTPDTGSAPATISASIKVTAGTTGNDYYDVVWITSPEAINSPKPVVFYFHYVPFAAHLSTTVDTVSLTVYECSQGQGNGLPSSVFSVLNTGLDFPQLFNLSYESDLFTTDITAGELPSFVEVTAKDPGLPLGVYYDTLWVVAPLALGSPKAVIVKYNKSAGTIQPQAMFNTVNLTLPTQENEGPIYGAAMQIQNKYGGCMPWEIVETIPWLTVTDATGDVPGSSTVIVDATGFPFGQYQDSFVVVAPGAVFDTTTIKIKMVVWKFFGDVNYDKRINILDLVYYVVYVFQNGPQPLPERRVGDVNCDRFINIQDLIYMVSYVFAGGPIPCGNPFK